MFIPLSPITTNKEAIFVYDVARDIKLYAYYIKLTDVHGDETVPLNSATESYEYYKFC